MWHVSETHVHTQRHADGTKALVSLRIVRAYWLENVIECDVQTLAAIVSSFVKGDMISPL